MKRSYQIALLLTMALAIWILNLYIHPDYFHSPDAAIYADTARNILNEGKAVTKTTFPQHLVYFSQTDKEGFYLPQFPIFFPLTITPFLAIFGENDLSVILANLLFYLLTGLFVYLLSEKLFNQKVAFFSSLFYLFNPQILAMSISGMSELLFAFEIILIFYLLSLKSKHAFFLIGITSGFALFTRFQSLILLLAIMGYIFFLKEERIKALVNLFLGILLTIVIFELFFLGNLRTLMLISSYHTKTSLGIDSLFSLSVSRSTETLDPSPLIYYGLYMKKVIFNLFKLLKEVIRITVPTILTLYFLSLFMKKTGNVKIIKNLLLAIFLLSLTSLVLFIFEIRYVYPLVPLMIIFATDSLLSVLKRTKLVILFSFIFIVLPTLTYNASATGALRVLSGARAKPTFHKLVAQIVAENIPTGWVIASDEANFISWYLDRTAVMIPKDVSTLEFLDKNLIEIDAIVLTSHPVGKPLGERWDELVMKPRDFGDFVFGKEFLIKEEANYYRLPAKVVLYQKK